MKGRLELTESFVYLLAKSTPRRRNVLLRNASNEELRSLCELCLNVIKGNLPLNKNAFQRLKRHRKTLETLASKRVPLKQKREYINQKGGIIGQLATIALPLLTHLITSKILK